MNSSLSRLASTAILATALAMSSAAAYAQGGGTTAPLTGLISDRTGAVLPGADVLVRNNATSAQFQAVTDANGRFVVPALNPGTYTVTVSLQGFKTLVLPDVSLTASTPASVKATLELGDLAEKVVVEGSTELVQTQTAAVQQTLVVRQIQQLPLVTRTALDLVLGLPGAQTSGAGSRGTILNGMPNVTINITLDGVNVQDNYNRSTDGFFMYVRPMLDSVEEVTVSSSTPGAESSGQGATQIRMVTRAGSNQFSGSVYNTWRNQAGTNDEDVLTRNEKRGWLWRLNTPYWFNKRDRPKTAAGEYFIDDVRLQTPGFRVGGPIVIPRLFDGHDKAFFFFNWEWFLWPNQIARIRYLLNPGAQRGVFTYPATDGSGNRTIDLLALAASKGFVSTVDPIVGRLLGDIRSAAAGHTGGAVSTWDLNNDKFDYSPGGNQKRHFPTLRLDMNLTRSHRLTFTGRYNRFVSEPDILNGVEPRFPGFANVGGQYSHRYMAQATVRSTVGSSLVNEARAGYAGGKTDFWTEVGVSQFNCTGLGCQGGYNLQIGGAVRAIGTNPLSPATVVNSPSSRQVPDLVFEDTLTWLKGTHTIGMGASFTQVTFDNWGVPGGLVPGVVFAVAPAEAAYSMLTASSGNFPGGISETYAGYARNLYALLVGDVNQITGSAVLGADGKYTYLGDRWQAGRMNELGVFVTDSWRLRPNLTFTGGLRWELQLPFQPDLSSWARPEEWTDVYGVTGQGNMFKPGTMTGRTPQFAPYAPGDRAYDIDWNNVAPSAGIVWQPNIGQGWLSRILGADPVFRGGYSIAYTRYGVVDFTTLYGWNPGSLRDMTRSVPLGNLGTDGLPVLLRETSRLQPPPTPGPPTYPFSPASSEYVAVFDPKIKVPFAQQYSLGWQREFGKTVALEIRYVGNRYTGGWTYANLNASENRFIIENGFVQEFRLAQRNLQANIAAGRGNTFAYTGAPGTSPLPIFLAHFAGIPLKDPRNQDPASYSASQFRSASFYDSLSLNRPLIPTITSTGSVGLQYVGLQANRDKAGLPANFWVANPDVVLGQANLQYNGGTTKYNGLQVELRQKMSKGLLVQGSYELSNADTWNRPTLREDFGSQLSNLNVDHAIKLSWVYELPFGQGRKWGNGTAGWLNQVIGGWEWDGVGRIQSGLMVNFGNYRLVGMTDKDLQKMFKIYKRKDAKGVERIYMLPDDVIQQSIIALYGASATSPTGWAGPAPTGRYIAWPDSPDCVQAYPGQCAPLTHFVRGPWITAFDMAFVKRFTLGKRARLEARMDLYNVFDAVNFNPVAGLGSTVAGWEVTSAWTDVNASQYAGGRMTQFGLRFSW